MSRKYSLALAALLLFQSGTLAAAPLAAGEQTLTGSLKWNRQGVLLLTVNPGTRHQANVALVVTKAIENIFEKAEANEMIALEGHLTRDEDSWFFVPLKVAGDADSIDEERVIELLQHHYDMDRSRSEGPELPMFRVTFKQGNEIWVTWTRVDVMMGKPFATEDLTVNIETGEVKMIRRQQL